MKKQKFVNYVVGLALCATGLTGCGYINKAGFDNAVKACEPNNGIQYIKPSIFVSGEDSVKCNNGAEFSLNHQPINF